MPHKLLCSSEIVTHFSLTREGEGAWKTLLRVMCFVYQSSRSEFGIPMLRHDSRAFGNLIYSGKGFSWWGLSLRKDGVGYYSVGMDYAFYR